MFMANCKSLYEGALKSLENPEPPPEFEGNHRENLSVYFWECSSFGSSFLMGGGQMNFVHVHALFYIQIVHTLFVPNVPLKGDLESFMHFTLKYLYLEWDLKKISSSSILRNLSSLEFWPLVTLKAAKNFELLYPKLEKRKEKKIGRKRKCEREIYENDCARVEEGDKGKRRRDQERMRDKNKSVTFSLTLRFEKILQSALILGFEITRGREKKW